FSAMSTFPLNSPYLSISLYNESNFCDFLVCATLSFAVSLVCLQEISPVKINRVKNVFFIRVFVFAFDFIIGYNGLRLCDVAAFLHKSSIELLMLNLAQMFHSSTSPAILQNRCYAVGFRFQSVLSLSLTAICPGLNGWTFHCSIATKYTTVALFWL